MREIQVTTEANHFSLSTGILPSLGATNTPRIRLKTCVLSPYDPRYRWWVNFLVLLVVYTAWVSPFEFGFLDKPIRFIAITDNVVNGFFALDIGLTFFVAYIDKITYLMVEDRKAIFLRYVKTWFFFDFISIIPSELARQVPVPPFQSYGNFNMLRLWRLRRISSLFARLEKDIHYNYCLVRSTKLTCATLFYVHLGGCIFYFIAAHYPEPQHTWVWLSLENFHQESLFTKYLYSMYWSATTLTTVGYGDLHPVNTIEMLFNIGFMLLNLALTSYLIGNISNLVVHVTSRTRRFRDTIQAATNFAERNHLPVRLKDQMLEHMCLRFRTDSEGLQHHESLETLPKAIRSSISRNLFSSVVDDVYLFSGVSKNLIFQLVTETKAEYFPPKEDVILQNEEPTDLYIIVTGVVDMLVVKNGVEEVVGEAKAGDVIGEIGVLCYRLQPFTVRTKRLCQLLRLNRTTFLNAIHSNVGDGNIIMNNLLQHLKELKDPFMDGILVTTENLLASGRVNLPLSLSFAALRGDDWLLHQLLNRGLDPNESDNKGRTALHIAACKGSLDNVMVLLDHGAYPNIRDYDGNVPLWEAIVGGHESVSKLLVENGANLECGDVGRFACIAAEQNNLNLLKDILKHGGDVSLPRHYDGITALHIAVCEGNIEIVKFLLEQGADVDQPDRNGWKPRALADQQGHEEIKAIFQSIVEPKAPIPANSTPERYVGRIARTGRNHGHHQARVTISCPEKSDIAGKIVLLPGSFKDLLEIGANRYGINASRILSKDGAEIDDLDVIRDGDLLLFVSSEKIFKSAFSTFGGL
ncbi:hypothetical protein QN277_006952 [Acacia crassicarpa]|uniref:Potassium channel n=1 Tax=Acacia crassicarpa TaxID=499986 RepID=A0AAE1IW88_9FABA|nr:hypothetical protein QN277_006952 [Acacia crassicarpa]